MIFDNETGLKIKHKDDITNSSFLTDGYGYIELYKNTKDMLYKENVIAFGKHYYTRNNYNNSYYTYLRIIYEDSNLHKQQFIRIYQSKNNYRVLSDKDAKEKYPELFI